jgi:hypothetical protein
VFPPSRIVCLTEETVETLYLIGEQECIVGISGYVVRPPQARREKPRVSAFTSANIDKILALKPDLVLTFSDPGGHRRASHPPWAQPPCVQPTERCRDSRYDPDGRRLSDPLISGIGWVSELVVQARSRAECLPKRPRVFFEE